MATAVAQKQFFPCPQLSCADDEGLAPCRDFFKLAVEAGGIHVIVHVPVAVVVNTWKGREREEGEYQQTA